MPYICHSIISCTKFSNRTDEANSNEDDNKNACSDWWEENNPEIWGLGHNTVGLCYSASYTFDAACACAVQTDIKTSLKSNKGLSIG